MAMTFIGPTSTIIGNHIPSTGELRYNENTKFTELYNGSDWVTVVGEFHGVDYEVRVNQLAEKHPGIKELKEQLDIMVKLASKDSDNGTN